MGDSIDSFATFPQSPIGDDFPISVFAKVHGTAFYKQMGEYFDGAEANFSRKMNGLSENPVGIQRHAWRLECGVLS